MHSPSLSMPSTELFQLLVVSADVTRVMATREAARAWPAAVAIDWVCTWHEALRRARELPAQLVVVDCNPGTAEGPALARHLARHVQEVDVIAFVDHGAEPAALRSSAWPWAALPAVLGEWLDLQIKLRAAPTGPAA